MTNQEADNFEKRISRFRELEKLRSEMYSALDMITAGDPTGPCGQNPFTGNTRESRQVLDMTIVFSPTRGGAPPVKMTISNPHIEASGLGQALQSLIRAKIALVTQEMDKV